MTARRFDSELIGAWLAYKAGFGSEPAGLDLPRLVVQPANRPQLSKASGRQGLLRPGEPQILGFEERELRLGERMLIARDRPGFNPRRGGWRIFGSGAPVRVRLGDGVNAESGPVRLQTIGCYLNRYVHTPEHGMADAKGKPCRLGTVGPLVVRATIAHGVRRVGKEAHDVGEWVAEPTRPADYGATRRDPRGTAERAFRNACRLLRRSIDMGRPAQVIDNHGRKVPDEIVRRAMSARSAPSDLRRAIITAGAAIAGRPALEPEQAVGLAAGTCAIDGCSRAAEGKSPRCAEHRHTAARERSRRYRAARRPEVSP